MPSRARWLRIRSTHARSSSSERTLPSESIGSRCSTFSRRPTGSPPTRCVGESGVRSSGMLALERAQLVEQAVVLVVADLRVVEHVVAVRVVLELLAQLPRARVRGGAVLAARGIRARRRLLRRGACGGSGAAHVAASGDDRREQLLRSKRLSASRLGRSVRSKWIGVTAMRPAATAARSVPGSSW